MLLQDYLSDYGSSILLPIAVARSSAVFGTKDLRMALIYMIVFT